jgi:hypothetical protein
MVSSIWFLFKQRHTSFYAAPIAIRFKGNWRPLSHVQRVQNHTRTTYALHIGTSHFLCQSVWPRTLLIGLQTTSNYNTSSSRILNSVMNVSSSTRLRFGSYMPIGDYWVYNTEYSLTQNSGTHISQPRIQITKRLQNLRQGRKTIIGWVTKRNYWTVLMNRSWIHKLLCNIL